MLGTILVCCRCRPFECAHYRAARPSPSTGGSLCGRRRKPSLLVCSHPSLRHLRVGEREAPVDAAVFEVGASVRRQFSVLVIKRLHPSLKQFCLVNSDKVLVPAIVRTDSITLWLTLLFLHRPLQILRF